MGGYQQLVAGSLHPQEEVGWGEGEGRGGRKKERKKERSFCGAAPGATLCLTGRYICHFRSRRVNICPLLKPPTTWRVVKGSLGRRGYNGWNICPCVCLCVCVCVKPRSCLAPLNRIKRLDMCFPLSGFSLPTSSGMLGGFSGRLFFLRYRNQQLQQPTRRSVFVCLFVYCLFGQL